MGIGGDASEMILRVVCYVGESQDFGGFCVWIVDCDGGVEEDSVGWLLTWKLLRRIEAETHPMYNLHELKSKSAFSGYNAC